MLNEASYDLKRQYPNSSSGKMQEKYRFRLRRAFVNPFIVILFVLAIVSYVMDV
nr:cation-transporting P-type ATPase [Lacrimispora celerecrescens]